MKFIIDSYPDFCPNCAKKLRTRDKELRRYQLEDFSLGASQQCDCGAEFQYVPVAQIVDLAAKHGDSMWDEKQE